MERLVFQSLPAFEHRRYVHEKGIGVREYALPSAPTAPHPCARHRGPVERICAKEESFQPQDGAGLDPRDIPRVRPEDEDEGD